VHSCFCGCGEKVVTPISPTGWQLMFDGDAISLFPSIGNWNFRCQSHYWIRGNQAIWAARWSKAEIARGRQRDREITDAYFGAKYSEANHDLVQPAPRRKSLVAWIMGR